MIVPAMSKKEVNREIVRAMPRLMKLVVSKTNHREAEARKKGYPDRVSSYKINEIDFWVFYFFHIDWDVSIIFCRYYDVKGPMYAEVTVHREGHYTIRHYLKHAIDQYNTRLKLQLNEVKDIIFYIVKNDSAMVRTVLATDDQVWEEVGFKSPNGLWLGVSEREIEDHTTHVTIIKTFIDEELVRNSQHPELSDDILKKLLEFEQRIGGDEHAQIRVNLLMDLFRKN